ncbi:MAG: response regulator [Kiritimatiellia bacterium]
MKQEDLTLNAHEAARLLGAHVETLRRFARRGEIPSFKIGTNWRFRKRDLEHWCETHHLRCREPRVLLVDDEARIRTTLRHILEKYHYIVSEADNGEEALDMLKKKTTPDAVLLDLKLPGMDGSAVLKEIREKYDFLPVIILTAYPDSDLMDRALKYPPIMMLPKPVGSKELLHTVRLALGARQVPGGSTP